MSYCTQITFELHSELQWSLKLFCSRDKKPYYKYYIFNIILHIYKYYIFKYTYANMSISLKLNVRIKKDIASFFLGYEVLSFIKLT